MGQGYMEDSEYGMIAGDPDDRKRILRAAKKRQQAGDPDRRLKRIDWLGDATVFKGLDHDAEFAKARLMPGQEQYPETWVIKFGTKK